MTTTRDSYIDFCRALAFVLVILHHSGIGEIGKYILGFHMPVFFIITGITFKSIHIENRVIKEYISRRVRQLLIPYLVFELINYGLTKILQMIKIGEFRTPFMSVLKSIVLCINNNEYTGISLRLWFLPCMALASILFVIIVHLSKRLKQNRIVLTLLIVSLTASYVVTEFAEKRFPFTVDISLLAVFYISLGYVFKEAFYKIRKFTSYKKVLIMALLFCMYVFCIRRNSGNFYMYENTYGDYWIAIAGSVLGSMAFLIAGDLFMPPSEKSYINLMMKWINKNSVIMFPIHLELLFFVQRIMNGGITNIILAGIMKTIVVILLMIPILNVIDYIKSKFLYMELIIMNR